VVNFLVSREEAFATSFAAIFLPGEQKAERIATQELKRLGWEKGDLRRRRKGDEGKVAVARRLRQETTMSLKWIAQRLQMGSWTYVSNLLNERSRH
jgi:hypothetical protein